MKCFLLPMNSHKVFGQTIMKVINLNGSLKIHLLCSVFLLSCGIIIVIIILKANSEKHRCDIFSLAVERSFKGNKYPPQKKLF